MTMNVATSDVQPTAWYGRIIRSKGHLSTLQLSVLMLVGCVPLAMALARVLALPGVNVPGMTALGTLLNNSVTLEWVPPEARWTIIYILFLPTAAVLIALARLTFGLRVLGFRSILIAVGFHEIGIVASLSLIAIVLVTILIVRPPMRRIQLPFYARIGVILCIATLIIVAALVLGPSLRSDTLWSFAFFPVIILAMLAEGIAATLARDDAWTAAWRAGWTIVLALLIASIAWLPAVREVALFFPELIVTQLVMIVLISEYLDLRLFEHWPAHLRRRMHANADAQPQAELSRIAVVLNRWNSNVIGRLGSSASSRERTQSVQVVVEALRAQGFVVEMFEADVSLLGKLHEFIPEDPRTRAPGGLVLNLAAGVQGRGRSSHVPAMLEMAGVAYTGPDPIVQSRLHDRFALMTLLRQCGVRTPRLKLMADDVDDPGDLRFPLVVRPRYELEEGRSVVKDRDALRSAVRRIVREHAQAALAEALEKVREFRVALLGNEAIECLPLMEVDASGKSRTCPAGIEEGIADRIRDCARAAYVAAGCRDYARIDIRLTQEREPQVVGVYTVGIFARQGSFAQSAEQAGYSFSDLMRRVVEIAWQRYRLSPAMQAPTDPVEESTVLLLEQRAASK